jgi:hypothetical protein
MRKYTLLLLLALSNVGLLFGQSTQNSVLETVIYGIGSSWPGECGPGVVSNVSEISRQNYYHSVGVVFGSGSWTVALNYSTTSCSGPWTSFGTGSSITQASSPPIAYGYGNYPFIQIAITGSAIVTYTAIQTPFIYSSGGGGGGMTNPMTTAGDVIYGGASGTPTRLGQPGNGLWGVTFLSSVPSWTALGGLATGSVPASGPVGSSGSALIAANANVIHFSNYGTGGGTAQAQTATLSTSAGLNPGFLQFCYLPSVANTGAAPTLNENSTGAVTVVKYGGGALSAGDLSTTSVACVIYDGTNYELQNPATGSGGGSGTTEYEYIRAVCQFTVPAVTGADIPSGSLVSPHCPGTLTNTAYGTIDFPGTANSVAVTGTQAQIQWRHLLPATYTSVTIDGYWLSATTGSTATLYLTLACAGNGASGDPAWDTARSYTLPAETTASYLVYITPKALTLPGSCAGNSVLYYQAYMNSTDGIGTGGTRSIDFLRIAYVHP